MAMKHSPVHIFWNVLLVLCACWGLQTGDADNSDSDLCLFGMDFTTLAHCYRNVSGQMQQQQDCDEDAPFEDPPCLLYPTNILNCTINSFLNSSQASASISTCDKNKKEVEILATGVTVKSASLVYTVKDISISSVILRINVSLPDTWTIYYHKGDISRIEVLSPPANINVSMINGSLVVRWDLPVLRSGASKAHCFEYELDINGDTKKRHVEEKQLHEEANIDPTLSYKVMLRTKKRDTCPGPQHWSEWSDAITLDPSTRFNWVFLGIFLGIPMILLSVLLLVRSCRESNVLFPRVPQPPIKYKAFLENDAALHFSPAVQSPDSVERISEVEETEATL